MQECFHIYIYIYIYTHTHTYICIRVYCVCVLMYAWNHQIMFFSGILANTCRNTVHAMPQSGPRVLWNAIFTHNSTCACTHTHTHTHTLPDVVVGISGKDAREASIRSVLMEFLLPSFRGAFAIQIEKACTNSPCMYVCMYVCMFICTYMVQAYINTLPCAEYINTLPSAQGGLHRL